MKKSDEFFKQEENSLGGNLLMAKYDKMNEANQRESVSGWLRETGIGR